MSRHVIGAAFIILALASAGSAQPAAQGRGQTPAPAEKPPVAVQGRGPAPAEAPAPPGQPVNVKLDLTITDQIGPGEPSKKIVTMIVADRAAGSIRSTSNATISNIIGNRAIINVDATPHLLPNGNVRVLLGLEYNPRQNTPTTDKVKTPSGDVAEIPREGGGSSLNQRVTLVLEPNKPLVFSQAADPMSDRKISVEVRATILK
jgi:hypothetical protein